jgi:hypothetical protein
MSDTEPSATDPMPNQPPAAAVAPAHSKAENLLLNIVCNVAVPTAILTWMSSDRWLGPKWGLLVALSFPVGYGLYDFIARRRWNFISIIGFVSVLFSGGFGLLKVGGLWFAVKDAAIPGIIGLVVLASMRAKTPLVTELLYNPQVIDVEKVGSALAARDAQAPFARLLRQSTGLLSLAFFVSAALNYALARHLLQSPPGTAAFNGELAKMHLLSWPVIVLPSMAMMMFVLWRLLRGITALTGLPLDDIFHSQPDKKAS